MIYDCFMYAGEQTLLDIRYQELAAKWDDIQMVAIEGLYTFTGQMRDPGDYPRGRMLERGLFSDTPSVDPWLNERLQRNYAWYFLKSMFPMKDEDIVIISDIDEIPRRHVILQYKPEFGICSLVMDQMYFYLNALASRQTWKHPKIMTWKDLRASSADRIRNQGTALGMLDAGHHFSYVGGESAIIEKLKSFSHQEPRVQALANHAALFRKINCLESPWSTDTLQIIESSELPVYIQRNPDDLQGYVL